jgi:hypothetical protein
MVFNPYNSGHIYVLSDLPFNELYLENEKLIKRMSVEYGINYDLLRNKVDHIKKVLLNWESYCDKYGMSYEDKELIAKSISLGLNGGKRDIKIKEIKKIEVKNNQLHKLTPFN